MTLRILIVDDEPAARRGVRRLLAAEPDTEVAGECGNGIEAVDAIASLRPDLVFLDIQMPGRSGLDVVREVGVERMPAVVFLTAFNQYAVDAFEVHALDYLVKPVEPARFADALQRARGRVREDARLAREALRAVIEELGLAKAGPWATRLPVRGPGRITLVDVERISVLEASGNNVVVKTGAEARPHVMRESLTALEARLDPKQFARVSRAAIVNLRRVVELQPLYDGDFVLVLDEGTTVFGTRRYRDRLGGLLG